jgi:hypothetical protein
MDDHADNSPENIQKERKIIAINKKKHQSSLP